MKMSVFRRFFRTRTSRTSKAMQLAEQAAVRLEEKHRRLVRQERVLLSLEEEILRLVGSASKLIERVKVISQTTADDIRDTQRDLERAEHAMEALRTAHQVDAEVTIPTLQARWEELKAKHEANIALSNHRRATLAPGNMEEV